MILQTKTASPPHRETAMPEPDPGKDACSILFLAKHLGLIWSKLNTSNLSLFVFTVTFWMNCSSNNPGKGAKISV
jgi:hypothetical protein